MPDCPDLRQIAGTRYRLAHDRLPIVRATDDPWLLTLPCRFGHVYPHGDGILGFASTRRGGVAKAVAALPGATIVQDTDDGMNITFPVAMFDEAAKLVQPKRRRQLTPEQRAACGQRLREHGAKFRFSTERQSDFSGVPASKTP